MYSRLIHSHLNNNNMSKTNHTRGVLTLGSSRKRKEREGVLDAVDKASKRTMTTLTTVKKDEPANDNRILAGYLAHEFLTKGTLFGQKWDPARAEAAPVSAPNTKRRAETKEAAPIMKHGSYADVANLLKSAGAHIPGIVNPAQLVLWLQM